MQSSSVDEILVLIKKCYKLAGTLYTESGTYFIPLRL